MSISFIHGRVRAAACALAGAAALAAAPAQAIENGALRIAPGWGGGELALPLLPGVVGTVGVMRYEATRLKDGNGNTPQVAVAPGVSAGVGGHVRVTAVISRVAWISQQKLFGGYLGAGALLPYLDQSQTYSLTGQFPPGTPPAMAGAIQGQLDMQAAAIGGNRGGWGDLELAPVLSWPGERSSVVFIGAFILPTGQYDAHAPVNAGAGNYKTFRPTLSWGYLGDGWDVGVRGAVAFNTRNKDTQVRSGSYLEADYSLLKHFAYFRAGVQGYVVNQFQDDDGPHVAADGNRSRALAIGPALSLATPDRRWLVDIKWLKEFEVRNRPEGHSTWLSVTRSF
jgi:hypothetical protein